MIRCDVANDATLIGRNTLNASQRLDPIRDQLGANDLEFPTGQIRVAIPRQFQLEWFLNPLDFQLVREVVQATRLAMALEPNCAAGRPLRTLSLEGIDTSFSSETLDL